MRDPEETREANDAYFGAHDPDRQDRHGFSGRRVEHPYRVGFHAHDGIREVIVHAEDQQQARDRARSMRPAGETISYVQPDSEEDE